MIKITERIVIKFSLNGHWMNWFCEEIKIELHDIPWNPAMFGCYFVH